MLLLRILFVLVGYSCACLGFGVLLLWLANIRSKVTDNFSAGTWLATAFILGQGALASLWLLLALTGWFSPRIIEGIVLVLVLCCFILSWRHFFDFANQVRMIWLDLQSDTWGWQALAGLTTLLCLAWVTSLGRPLTVDATAFYFVLPKIVAASHQLIPIPGTYEAFTSVGLQGEMHYAALMALRSPDAAKLFAWPTILAGAIMFLALGRHVGLERRGQWIALAMLFTSSAVIWLSGDGKVDLFAVSLGFAAYYWANQVRNDSRRLALWLTGLFSGFALVAKLSYAPALLPGIALLVGWGYLSDFRERTEWKSALTAVTIGGVQVLLGLLVALLPHLIKNGLLFNNPIAPFGTDLIGSLNQEYFGQATTRRILLTYPLAITFGNYWAQYGNLSPLVLAFLPLALFLPRPRDPLASPLIMLSLAALLGVLAWIIPRPSQLLPRYMLATLLLFVFLPARAAEFVSHHDSRPRWLTVGIMGTTGVTLVVVGLYFLNIVFFPLSTYTYITGQISDCGRSDTQHCIIMSIVNDRVPKGDRIFLASYERYWLRPDLLQCSWDSGEFRELVVLQTADERWEYLYERGFRYLLVDQNTHLSMFDNLGLDLESPPTWLKINTIYGTENKRLRVYHLEAINPPVTQFVTCSQVDPPAWDVESK